MTNVEAATVKPKRRRTRKPKRQYDDTPSVPDPIDDEEAIVGPGDDK